MSAPVGGHVFYRSFRKEYPTIERGEGVYLYDSLGRRYLDASGGAVVVAIGHGVPEIAEAMQRQMARVSFAHTSQFTNEPQERLAAALAALAPGDLKRILFVSGGSEAVEAAIKLARQYHLERGRPGKHRVVGRWQSYHGTTLGALSASGHVGRRRNSLPLLLDFPHIPPCHCYHCPFDRTYPDCRVACATELETAIRREGPDSIAAFIAEPVVGAAAGATVPPREYFPMIRDICDRHDILFIADEVMTGLGRTGRNFAIEHWGVTPDLIATGKGIASGYAPLGALLVSDRICRTIEGGSGAFAHGHTYMGHPLSCAIGLAVLEYVQRHDLIRRCAAMGEVLMRGLMSLRDHPLVGDIRGKGLMVGVELVEDKGARRPFDRSRRAAETLAEIAFANGLIIYPGTGGADGVLGDHVLIAPPFVITEEEIGELVSSLGKSLDELARRLG